MIRLADGRQIRLSHDLAGGVDSSARDARYANRDLSNEIMNDGGPDGAVWLGLDRRSFQSVACVRQSELLSILDDADALQRDLQRAAATARTDATASDAVGLLREYRREHVGTPRSPTKPLRRSEAAVKTAQGALTDAGDKHASYRARRRKIDALEREVIRGETRVAVALAVQASARAVAASKRHAEACKLNDRFPDGPPREPPARDELAQRIAAALRQWRTLPSTLPEAGPTALEIEERIAELEAEENALLAVQAEQRLVDAEQRLTQARQLAIQFSDERRPVAPSEDVDLARRVASALEKWDDRPTWQAPSSPSVDEMEADLRVIDLEEAQLTGASSAVEVLRSTSRIGLAAFLAAEVSFALVRTVLSWTAFSALLLAGVWWSIRALAKQAAIRRRQQAELVEKRRQLERAITTRQLDDREREEDRKRLDQAEHEIRHAGEHLGVAAEDLDSIVETARKWQARRSEELREFSQRTDDWDSLQRLLGGRSLASLVTATAALKKEVIERVAAADEPLLSAARHRNISSEDLAEFRRQADEERGRLRTALGHRQAEDRTHQQRTKQREAAIAALATVARDAGINGDEPHDQVDRLDEWLEHRRGERQTLEQKTKEWDRLQQLLGDSSLNELGHIAAELTETARSRSAEVAPETLAGATERGTTESEIAELRSDVEEKKEELQRSLGEIREFRSTLPDLARATEALTAAEAERARVLQLDSILEKTINYLRAAEDRVHRDLAPVLQQGVLQKLSHVTGGRYVDCRVNPETLTVEVSGRDRPWRPATNLSHGTAEQIYLLLRLTLTRHLGKPEEPCPLILDDPVGASDEDRRNVLLETLLEISNECQVIVFTHDNGVREWAKRSLTTSRSQLEHLDAAGVQV